jgi:dinuclear metal center YbgI/SA1388 family protein
MKTERLFQYVDELLDIQEFPDYGTALNGLQIGGPDEIDHLAEAVDVSEETIAGAVEAEADVLLVHHGLFWSGLRPATGRRFRKLAGLIRNDVGLYSAHLPLDAHPEVGNSAVLARELGIEPEERFGRYEDAGIGWAGSLELHRDELHARLRAVLGGEALLIPGGSSHFNRVAVVTGSGGSFVEDAARADLAALVTGEGSHHTYVDATELGINLYYGGHYATETWGVRALARHLEDRFGLAWSFIDAPSGL